MVNKHKHLEFIQSAISRMALNSFYLKGWSITIVAALIALSIRESDYNIYAVSLFLTAVFWFLDAYYLQQEKLFRELYNKVLKVNDDDKIDFSMDTGEFKEAVAKIPCIMFWNISITPLYLSISMLLIVLIHFI